MPVPDALDWPQAGGVPEVFTTAHDALFTQAGLRAGERLLVHGAAGGVGTAAVQLGAAAGAQRDRHGAQRGAARRRGRARRPRGRSRPRASPSTAPSTWSSSWSARRTSRTPSRRWPRGGRIVVIGVGAGFKAEVNLLALMGKRARIMASTLRARPLEEKAAHRARDGAQRAAAVRRGRCACRSPRPSRSTRSPTPTSASPPAASSARSSCCRETPSTGSGARMAAGD